ncbi:Aminopeptidase [Balamuthia mandrillaris]
MRFTGILNDKMKGFYRSKYTNAKGEEAFMAVTQFEATDARRAFPCWDEPALKATFDVTITALNHFDVLSNMPLIDKVQEGEFKTVKFATTPIMSTYLLAFVVGEFDYLEDTTTNGVVVRVYTPKGKKEQGRFGLDVAVKTLPFYEDYFKISYPLPKCDLIAIPDFAAGAMENWGLITYRETALLVDPESSSAHTRQWVALVVGHELAHQWFGNIVTMDWWTHLWLNEGFATWIEYLCVDYCFPEWNIWTQFVFSDLGRAFNLDALKSTHPVEVEVSDAADIDEIFDIISYSKGSSIVRMLANFLGEEAFKKGLNIYLNRHKYANALTEDLWAALSEASGKPVKELMDHWTKQDGYPVVSIVEKKSEEKGKRTFVLKQQRFLSTGLDPKDTTTWWIPLTISTESSGGDTFAFADIVKQKETTLSLPAVGTHEWIKVNPNVSGFYRVQYSLKLLEDLRAPIQDRQLSAADRLSIQGDTMALAKAGVVPTTHFLTLLSAYLYENDYTVWSDLSTNLSELDTILSATEDYPLFKEFCKHMYSQVTKLVGWDRKAEESHGDSLLRGLALAKYGCYGDEATIEEARKRFDVYLNDPSSLSPDLRSAVYKIVLSNAPHGDATPYEALLKIYRETDLHEEKERCMRSLGSASDPYLLKKTLEFAISNEVKSQDTVFVIGGVAANPAGRDMAWEFVQEHWDELYSRFSGGFLLSRLVSSTISVFSSDEKAEEIKSFFEKREVAAAKRAVTQSLEKIKANSEWLKREHHHISGWLKRWTKTEHEK